VNVITSGLFGWYSGWYCDVQLRWNLALIDDILEFPLWIDLIAFVVNLSYCLTTIVL